MLITKDDLAEKAQEYGNRTNRLPSATHSRQAFTDLPQIGRKANCKDVTVREPTILSNPAGSSTVSGRLLRNSHRSAPMGCESPPFSGSSTVLDSRPY